MPNSEIIYQQQGYTPQPQITERNLNAQGGGPYYVLNPGFDIAGITCVNQFHVLKGGQVQKLVDSAIWTRGGLLPDGAAQRQREIRMPGNPKPEINHSFTETAAAKRDALIADRTLVAWGVCEIPQFANVDAEIEVFNKLILPEDIEEGHAPLDCKWLRQIDNEGMISVRHVWLTQAAEALKTGQMLESIRAVIRQKEYLRQIWYDAITRVIQPKLQVFTTFANEKLNQSETAIRANQKQKGYDQLDQRLLWFTGRKPAGDALGRALDPKAQGAITAAIVSAAVKEVLGERAPAPQQVQHEQTQCPECGEFLNMIAGGPPRKCRFCGHEFYAADGITAIAAPVPAISQPVSSVTMTVSSSNGNVTPEPPQPEPEQEFAPLDTGADAKGSPSQAPQAVHVENLPNGGQIIETTGFVSPVPVVEIEPGDNLETLQPIPAPQRAVVSAPAAPLEGIAAAEVSSSLSPEIAALAARIKAEARQKSGK